jgi:hypothetical protein
VTCVRPLCFARRLDLWWCAGTFVLFKTRKREGVIGRNRTWLRSVREVSASQKGDEAWGRRGIFRMLPLRRNGFGFPSSYSSPFFLCVCDEDWIEGGQLQARIKSEKEKGLHRTAINREREHKTVRKNGRRPFHHEIPRNWGHLVMCVSPYSTVKPLTWFSPAPNQSFLPVPISTCSLLLGKPDRIADGWYRKEMLHEGTGRHPNTVIRKITGIQRQDQTRPEIKAHGRSCSGEHNHIVSEERIWGFDQENAFPAPKRTILNSSYRVARAKLESTSRQLPGRRYE